MRLLLRWLSGVLKVTLLLLVLLVSVVLMLAGTESGTRWILRHASTVAPIEFDAERASGTLLSTLNLPAVRYVDKFVTIDLTKVETGVHWRGLPFALVDVDRFSAQSVTLRVAEKPAGNNDAKPFELSMPALPVQIRIGKLAVGEFIFADNVVTDIAIVDAQIKKHRISVAHATAAQHPMSIQLQDFSVNLHADVNIAGKLAWQMADSPWSGAATLGGSLRELQLEHQLQGEITATTAGTLLILGQREPMAKVVNDIEPVAINDWHTGRSKIRFDGTANSYQLVIESSVVAETGDAAAVSGTSDGSMTGLYNMDFTLLTDIASVGVTGSISWSPELAIDAVLRTRDLHTASLLPGTDGTVDAEVHVSASGPQQFTLDIRQLTGRWNGEPATGGGKLSRDGDLWQCNNCDINVGRNHIQIDGQLNGSAISASANIDAPSLQQLWPTISGSLSGNGRLGGTLSLPGFSGSASGNSLAFAEFRVASFIASSRNSTPEFVNFVLAVEELYRGETRLGNATLTVQGKLEDSRIAASWIMDDYTADTSLQLSVVDDTISGTVISAKLFEPVSGRWTLDDSFDFSYSPDSVTLGKGTWTNEGASITHHVVSITDGDISIEANLNDGPLTLLNLLTPERISMSGLADADVMIRRVNDVWSGNIDWRQQDTMIRIRHGNDETYEIVMPVVEANVLLVDGAGEVRARLNTTTGFNASLEAKLGKLAADGSVDARLRLDGNDWGFMPALVQDIENFTGNISADIVASGSLDDPNLSGELNWTNGQLAIPALNLPFEDINITLTGSSAGVMEISGNARSGHGTITVGGQLNDVASTSPSFTAEIRGEQADVLNWPDYRLIASPDLRFAGNLDGVHMTGSIAIDEAEIIVRELPEDTVKPSDDVTVEGREIAERHRTRFTGDVTLTLGQQAHINAFGLDTKLEGTLRFIVPDGRDPQGEGEVRLIGGFFEAYGQRLEIEKGTMVFTGPLDNPIIDVRAVRKIETVDRKITAGIWLTGRAQNIVTSVYSDPAMPEADALSYLVLGRPLQDATAGEGGNLTDTAYALGLRQAGLITNQIGQTVGLDELIVAGNNQATTSLIAGKQINNRLYVRYAFGVFSKLGNLLLRYRISDSFSLEIGAGERQSMDILYIIEKQ